MSRWQGILAALAAAAIFWALPARAGASTTEQSMLMDDDQLIYVGPQHMEQTLRKIAALGVDTVKVSVVWQLIAPNAYSTKRPHFDASNPAAYPSGVWTRYDTLVKDAQNLGMQVYFLLIGPAPAWAVPAHNRTSGQGPVLGQAPNPRDYEQFVEAVGRRYSGAYVDPSTAADPAPTTIGGITVPGVTTPSAAPAPQPIPRVNYWGIWNEPNERSWLNPWYARSNGQTVLLQPELYRGLVDAAWRGLAASDHESDTIMIGETANRGEETPDQFVRMVYCVSGRLQPLSGAAATAAGCPSSGSPSQFLSQHPGLFEAAGWAHHPYAFDTAPDRPYPQRSYVTLDNLPAFERMLDTIYGAYGVHPGGGVPIFLTEWGYKTNPPNPYVKTSEAQQAAWLNEGEYMTWRDPWVRALTQFLLVDSPPKPDTPKGSPLYWSTFQTGLETANGAPKPAFGAFRIPIWLPVARHGPRVTVWGQLRPADHTQPQDGVIEFQPSGSTRWSELAEVQTSSPEGFLINHVRIPGAGVVRLGWLDPNGSVVYSRPVTVS